MDEEEEGRPNKGSVRPLSVNGKDDEDGQQVCQRQPEETQADAAAETLSVEDCSTQHVSHRAHQPR